MRLNEMGAKPTAKQMNKVMESRFGFRVDYDNLTFKKAFKMATAIGESLDKIKSTHGVHTAEKNPQYMELLMVRESLHSWMRDNKQQLIVESEMAKSEAILAAKDMVDSIQDMLEKIGKMQNEQLPALLGELSQTLQQGRETADSAARGLTGEEVGGGDMGLGGAPDLGPSLGGGMDDLETSDLDAGGDEFGASDAAAGGPDDLGREVR
jgi:hypothetical protein